MARLRLIPATIAVAVLLIAVKMVEVTRGVEGLLVPPAIAQTAAEGEKKGESAKKDEKKPADDAKDAKKESAKKKSR